MNATAKICGLIVWLMQILVGAPGLFGGGGSWGIFRFPPPRE